MNRLVTCALLLAAPLAVAAEVFVNGVNVDGLTDHTFEKVTVRLDEKGNVHIEAPGYSVKKVTVGGDKAEAPVTARYFLVTEQNVPGMTEYDVDVFLNGKFLRTVKSTEDQVVQDITRQLKPGKNQVILQAKKRYADPMVPKSSSRAHVFRVIIGEGTSQSDQVTIDKQLVTFVRTAADTDPTTQEFSFSTR